MEEFDLVNELDEVVGTTNKEKSHKDAGIHRVVAVYVFTPDGKLYMQDHIKSGMWDHSVGGHVSKGEDYDTAVQREGFEELGLKGPYTKVSHFYSDETIRGKHIKHFFTLYECTPEDWEFLPNEEVKRVEPYSIIEIVDWMNKEHEKFTPGFMNTMSEYIKVKRLPHTLIVR